MIKLKSLFRRGQAAPSASKYGPGQQPQQPPSDHVGLSPDTASASSAAPAHLKTSSSTSNIDGLGLSKAEKKRQKEFGSRDNLDRKEHKSSRDRLVENLRGKPKSSKKQAKQEALPQMSLVQQPPPQQQQQQNQQQAQLPPNVAAFEHRPSLASTYATVEDALTKELTEINFDGPHGDSRANQVHELRLQLDQLAAEKRNVEAKLVEMSSYQAEVVALRQEVSKMMGNHDSYTFEVQRLRDENESLRTHLRDVVHSPLSDSEKQKIIDDSQRLHNSAPASIALPSVSARVGLWSDLSAFAQLPD